MTYGPPAPMLSLTPCKMGIFTLTLAGRAPLSALLAHQVL